MSEDEKIDFKGSKNKSKLFNKKINQLLPNYIRKMNFTLPKIISDAGWI